MFPAAHPRQQIWPSTCEEKNLPRLDRLLTLYFFRPFTSVLPARTELRIPILMYHSISDDKEAGHPYYWINTSPARFAQHMKFLYENHYSVISLSDAVNILTQNPSTPLLNHSTTLAPSTHPRIHASTQPPFVVLTFDDGYLDFYTHAFPVLRQFDFTATVFLPTAYIDGKRPGLRGKEHLTWDQVRELHEAGVRFGSHTVNHPQLHDLSWDEIEYELRESKSVIESQLQSSGCFSNQSISESIYQPPSITSFCYPYKFAEQDTEFIGELKMSLRSAGYRVCTTTRIGSARHFNDNFFLPRLPVNSGDDVDFLKAKMADGYDWLGRVQRLTKAITRGKACLAKQISLL